MDSLCDPRPVVRRALRRCSILRSVATWSLGAALVLHGAVCGQEPTRLAAELEPLAWMIGTWHVDHVAPVESGVVFEMSEIEVRPDGNGERLHCEYSYKIVSPSTSAFSKLDLQETITWDASSKTHRLEIEWKSQHHDGRENSGKGGGRLVPDILGWTAFPASDSPLRFLRTEGIAYERTLSVPFLTHAGTTVTVSDPAYRQPDLVPELDPLAWMIGSWEPIGGLANQMRGGQIYRLHGPMRIRAQDGGTRLEIRYAYLIRSMGSNLRAEVVENVQWHADDGRWCVETLVFSRQADRMQPRYCLEQVGDGVYRKISDDDDGRVEFHQTERGIRRIGFAQSSELLVRNFFGGNDLAIPSIGPYLDVKFQRANPRAVKALE